MTTDEMKKKKKELGLTGKMIAEESGIPLATVLKIFSGETKAPRKATLDAILSVLMKHDRESAGRVWGTEAVREGRPGHIRYHFGMPDLLGKDGNIGLVRESQAAYIYDAFPKGNYTTEDYYALPDDQRVELIDGVFYDMSAPAVVHQIILGELYLLFRECIDRHDCPCRVCFAPCDVRLDCDNKTMVQPDLLVICEGLNIHAKALEGAPDLVPEILSPSTRSKDMLLKLHKYREAGAREYWIVDPERQTVIVYDFEKDPFVPVYYPFKEKIPVGISEGKCAIDFARVLQAIEDYYRE